MERKETMFHLDSATEDWKKAYGASEAVSVEALDELESHLRDSVETIAKSGFSEEEAFLVATHRLGSAPQLAGEYDKVHQGQVWLSRTILMLSGYLLLSLCFKFIAFDQTAAGALSMAFGLGATEIPLPHLGYHLHSSALIQGGIGFAGLGVMAWIILSFARGKWQMQPKRIWVMLACWAGAYLTISLVQFGLQLALQFAMVQRVSTTEFGVYSASASVVSVVYQLIAAVLILGLTALLSRRYVTFARRS